MSQQRAALSWKGLVLLIVACGFVVAGILWVWWPPRPQPLSPTAPLTPETRPIDPSLQTETPRDQTPEADPIVTPGGGYGIPVRVLTMSTANGTYGIELCDTPATMVKVRWYATNPPSGPVMQEEIFMVTGGRAIRPLEEALTPTAQSMESNGRPVGSEVGPGQTGQCP